MITGYPTPLATWAEPAMIRPPRVEPSRRAPVDGSWRYEPRRMSRLAVVGAALASAALHA